MRAPISILLFAVFCCQTLFAQDIRVAAKVDTNVITLGDWIRLSVEVQRTRQTNVIWQSLKDTLGAFDIIRKGEIQRRESDDKVIETSEFIISKYDSGSFDIPPLTFTYTVGSDTTKKEIATFPIPILVQTVAIDTTAGIKDIKPPIDIPMTLADMLPYIGLVVLLIAISVGVYLYLKKQRMKELGEYVEPSKPAHEIAIAALIALEEKRLWQKGLHKQYHSEVTEIIRRYIEQRYDVMALEMTTDEIMEQLQGTDMPTEIQMVVLQFLRLADFVKFAKYLPLPQENEESMKQAYQIVNATKVSLQTSIMTSEFTLKSHCEERSDEAIP
jgi:hypothetical protein